MNKVLIIKLGYSETLNKETSTTTSLGDVLRTTVILNFLKGADLSWLVDKKAASLLEGNPYIRRVLIYNLETVLQLQSERFDTVINLEKVPGICALADSIGAWRRFGFRFDACRGQAQSYDGAEKVLSLSLHLDKKRKSRKYWQEALAEMIGKKWDGQEYILGYKPKLKQRYDLGFNWVTGSKWENKAWPKGHWQKLEKLLKKDYSLSWQEGLRSLDQYMDWINSCRLIVTNDSLGMHLALAFKKKLVVLFGPSSSQEVYLYGRGRIVTPTTRYKCVPCLKRECYQKKHCMSFIDPIRIKQEVDSLLGKTKYKSQSRDR